LKDPALFSQTRLAYPAPVEQPTAWAAGKQADENSMSASRLK
jgi:hypothetical protein